MKLGLKEKNDHDTDFEHELQKSGKDFLGSSNGDCMALGRPRVANTKKHRSISISLPPAEIVWLTKTATAQGVPMSQIMFDAIQSIRGELLDTLAGLREELADQAAIIDRLQSLATQQQNELKRLQASQDHVGAIVSPYGNKPAPASKMDGEKARVVRAVAGNELSRMVVKRRAEGDEGHHLLPIHTEGLKAFGTWKAFHEAIEAFRGVK